MESKQPWIQWRRDIARPFYYGFHCVRASAPEFHTKYEDERPVRQVKHFVEQAR